MKGVENLCDVSESTSFPTLLQGPLENWDSHYQLSLLNRREQRKRSGVLSALFSPFPHVQKNRPEREQSEQALFGFWRFELSSVTKLESEWVAIPIVPHSIEVPASLVDDISQAFSYFYRAAPHCI
jgi:hypothetical protein